MLNIFAEEGVNMSKIQSMPVLGKRNEYNFYVDIEWDEARHIMIPLNQADTKNTRTIFNYPRRIS